MDWQQAASLVIVAGTVVCLARHGLRRRRPGLVPGTVCGCTNADSGGTRDSIVYHARKGERPRIIVKWR